jgi:hypothetical protein
VHVDGEAVLEGEPPVPGDVVGVGVRLQRRDQPDAVPLRLLEVGLDPVRRVDHDRDAGVLVADEVRGTAEVVVHELPEQHVATLAADTASFLEVTQRPRRLSVLLAGLAFLTCSCGAHGGAQVNGFLVLDRSIGPVSLGELRSAAEPRLGKAVVLSSTLDRSARPKPARVVRAMYPSADILVWWIGAQGRPLRAFILQTSSPAYRTRGGIGVGSTLAKLRSLGVLCNVGADCQHGYAAPDHAGTAFRLSGPNGRVVEISISFGH